VVNKLPFLVLFLRNLKEPSATLQTKLKPTLPTTLGLRYHILVWARYIFVERHQEKFSSLAWGQLHKRSDGLSKEWAMNMWSGSIRCISSV